MITTSHPEWAETRKWIDGKIAEAHQQLENPQLPIGELNALQGEIRAYRNFIKAATPGITGVRSSTDYNG